MAMLQKERWIFDTKRGLPRDTRDPQQSDQPLRSYDKPTPAVPKEPDIVVKKKKPIRRARPKPKQPEVIADDSDDASVESIPNKKQKKGKVNNVQAPLPASSVRKGSSASASGFDKNVTDIEITNNCAFNSQTQKPSSLPPLVPKAPPSVTREDINTMMDSKLEQILLLITHNQKLMEENMTKALLQQKAELASAIKSVPSSQEQYPNSAFNFTSPGVFAGGMLYYYMCYCELNYIFSGQQSRISPINQGKD